MRSISQRVFKAGCILAISIIGLTGCGINTSPDSSNPKAPNTSIAPKDAIKIEDISWETKESILDGERFISFDYTNKSNYTILDVEMTFRQKDGTTVDQLAVFDNLKTERDWSDEEISEIYILAYNRKSADPGETVSESPCVINGTYILVENIEQFEIMEPDIVEIAFIGDDGKGYTIYYDFKTQVYGQSSQGGLDLQQWSESEISSHLPKGEFKATIVNYDDEDYFSFKAFGVSREEFEAYVEEVKKNGFTEVDYESHDSYSASNVDGISVSINYNMIEEMMTGSIE